MSSRFKSGILLVCGVAALNENWWLMQRSCRNEFRRVGAEEEEGESINQMIRLIDSIRLLKWIDRKKSINQMWAGLNWLDSLQLNAHLPTATISHDFIHLFRSIAGKLILIVIQTLNLIGNFPLITHTHTHTHTTATPVASSPPALANQLTSAAAPISFFPLQLCSYRTPSRNPLLPPPLRNSKETYNKK